jgi:hypothetical protein
MTSKSLAILLIEPEVVVTDVHSQELDDTNEPSGTAEERAIGHIRNLMRKIRHGSITIIVQDGHVLQIDHTIKQRPKIPGQWEK